MTGHRAVILIRQPAEKELRPGCREVEKRRRGEEEKRRGGEEGRMNRTIEQ